MKSLSLGLAPLFLFAGLAAAQQPSGDADRAVTTTSTTTAATTPSAPSTFAYTVRHDGREGQLIIGDQEVSFQADNSKHSMAWNYDSIKKLKTRHNDREVDLILHGGETQRFKLQKGEAFSDSARNMVTNRAQEAPRYQRP